MARSWSAAPLSPWRPQRHRPRSTSRPPPLRRRRPRHCPCLREWPPGSSNEGGSNNNSSSNSNNRTTASRQFLKARYERVSARLPSIQKTHYNFPSLPQEVKKFIKEPSYSTILLPQVEASSSAAQLRGQQGLQQTVLEQQQQQHHHLYVNLEVAASSSGADLLEEASSSHYALDGGASSSIYQSPPSPVSSSYSELRQATKARTFNFSSHTFD